MVGTTLLASLLVVAVVGVLLVQQLGRGLVDGSVRQAVALAETGLAGAQRQLETLDTPTTADLQRLQQQLAAPALSSGLYVPIISSADGTVGDTTDRAVRAQVPAELVETVRRDGTLAYAFASVGADVVPAGVERQSGERPFLVVGGQLSDLAGSRYDVFFLFPLDAAAESYALVRRVVAAAGLALVGLLVLVAYLLSRQVVTPVRAVALSAERIAGGLLGERVPASGEDETARLAQSFNAMAAGLQAQIRRLEELSRLQQRFVSDVSHELRTPLTTVRMAADLLHESREDLDPPTARAAELLQRELDRFERLLADLLEISRFDAQAAVLGREPVDVADLVRDTRSALAGLAHARGSEVDLAAVPEEPVVADVDRRRVERVLRNLLSNALEYGEGRPVQVALAADDDAVEVVVRDAGRGLSAEERARLFDRFWRADTSRRRTSGGTGLGLSIALEDVRLHDGTIDVWGEPGQGASVRVTVPRRAGSVPGAPLLPLGPVAPGEAPPVPPPPSGEEGSGDVAEAAGAVGVEVGGRE